MPRVPDHRPRESIASLFGLSRRGFRCLVAPGPSQRAYPHTTRFLLLIRLAFFAFGFFLEEVQDLQDVEEFAEVGDLVVAERPDVLAQPNDFDWTATHMTRSDGK